MSFLPLVQRELRAAARRKSTVRVRLWTAVVAMFASFSSLMIAWLSGRGGPVGASLFSFLSGYAFCLCLLAGVFFTTDCLSQEKRQGTLGLLFLTNLKGYDVVLGKFCAASLNALYGLLALLPFLGLPLLLGGVTGNEFWRMALALVNALFFSLAIGICASAFAQDLRWAAGVTLGVLLATAALPALARVAARVSIPAGACVPTWLSPFAAFASVNETTYLVQPARFWGALGVTHLVAWLSLALASLALPRHWAGAVPAARGSTPWWRRSRSYSAAHALRRRRLLELSPIAWLASPDAGLAPIAWLLVCLWGLIVLPLSFLHFGDAGVLLNAGFGAPPFGGLAGPFGFLLKALCVVQAARFFTEARREGLLEPLLCAPLTSRELVAGQSLALRKLFGPPTVVYVLLALFPGLLMLVTAWITQDISRLWSGGFTFFLSLIYCVRLGADLAAAALVAMWLALSLRRPNYAPVLTILYVLVLPSFLCWLDFIADVVFIIWASARLQLDFRWVVSGPYAPTPSAHPPPVIAPPVLPPVIPR